MQVCDPGLGKNSLTFLSNCVPASMTCEVSCTASGDLRQALAPHQTRRLEPACSTSASQPEDRPGLRATALSCPCKCHQGSPPQRGRLTGTCDVDRVEP